MRIKSLLAVTAGKATRLALKLTKNAGTSLPGKMALRVDPDILRSLTKDSKIVMISGTNGKTLTTAMITNILKQKYHVITNESGSNMIQGITSTFLSSKVKKDNTVAVLEVDEAYIRRLQPYMNIDTVVFTNIFRDQMDRFGEIYTTYSLMCEGIEKTPSTKVIVNGDLPIFNDDKLSNPKVYYGFNHMYEEGVTPHYNSDGLLCLKCHSLLHYHLNTYSNLGKYYCKSCGFKRPELKYAITSLDKLTIHDSEFSINNDKFKINVAGTYNIYNALAAYSLAKEFGLSNQEIQAGFDSLERKFGRQESFNYEGKEVILNLVKNPVGFDQIVDLVGLDTEKKTLISLLNDNYADGKDVSWIWDGNYEKLATYDFSKVYAGGKRKEELAFRLEVAGFSDITILENFSDILNAIKQASTKRVYIFSTYTALLQLRADLAKENIIKGDMK